MVVFSSMGATDLIIDGQLITNEQTLKAAVKKELSMLDDCCRSKDWQSVLKILLDPKKSEGVRIKASEIIGDIGEPEAIEPIKNHKFRNHFISSQLEKSVGKIHE